MLVLCLMMSGSAIAENGNGMKGWMLISPYVGYSFGFGDAFKDYEFLGETWSRDAGISFGGAYHYGVSPMFLVGGELGFQSYKTEVSVGGLSVSDSEIKMNIIGSGLYALSWTENEQAFFVTFGAGYYGGWEAIGLNGGILYSKMVNDKYPLFLMPRIHIVFDDPDTAMMFQILFGISFPIAGYPGS